MGACWGSLQQHRSGFDGVQWTVDRSPSLTDRALQRNSQRQSLTFRPAASSFGPWRWALARAMQDRRRFVGRPPFLHLQTPRHRNNREGTPQGIHGKAVYQTIPPKHTMYQVSQTALFSSNIRTKRHACMRAPMTPSSCDPLCNPWFSVGLTVTIRCVPRHQPRNLSP